MAAMLEQYRQNSVDVDPDWYAGQPETEDVITESVPAVADHPATHVPTVLQKLLKWGNYNGYGEPVWPSRFIPMKTPLSEEILDSWELSDPPKYRLTVPDLLAAQTAAGRHVGLLLDLSNHDCLYASDIPPSVQYLHVQLVAKELPPLEFVHEVGHAANQFWDQHPNDYIAIHCAYGFNRTGFVVCSYLIEHCGLSVEQALASFARSRPPGVKHEKFRNELHARYGSINQSVPRPITCLNAAAVYAACNCSDASSTVCAEQTELLPAFLQLHLLCASAGATDAEHSSCSQCSSTTQVQSWGSSGCRGRSNIEQCKQQMGQSPPNAGWRMLGQNSSRQLPPIPSNSSVSSNGCSPGALRQSSLQNKGALCVAALSSSPLPRMPSRSFSNCSIGDNSSIGSPPDESILLQGGSNHSTHSSSVGSIPGYRGTSSIGGCSPSVLDQRRYLGSSSLSGSGVLAKRSSGSSGANAATAAARDAYDANVASEDEEQLQQQDGAVDTDCFEMDPCGEVPGGSSGNNPWSDGHCCQCRQQVEPEQQQQQCHTAELSGLMDAVHLGQQQQPQLQHAGQLRHPHDASEQCSSGKHCRQDSIQHHQHQEPVSPIGCCSCSCHTSESGRNSSSSGCGYELGGQQSKRCSRLQQYGQLDPVSCTGGAGCGSSTNGHHDLIENESFGKVSSAELLKNLK